MGFAVESWSPIHPFLRESLEFKAPSIANSCLRVCVIQSFIRESREKNKIDNNFVFHCTKMEFFDTYRWKSTKKHNVYHKRLNSAYKLDISVEIHSSA